VVGYGKLGCGRRYLRVFPKNTRGGGAGSIERRCASPTLWGRQRSHRLVLFLGAPFVASGRSASRSGGRCAGLLLGPFAFFVLLGVAGIFGGCGGLGGLVSGLTLPVFLLVGGGGAPPIRVFCDRVKAGL
jgi:hypothetical protein